MRSFLVLLLSTAVVVEGRLFGWLSGNNAESERPGVFLTDEEMRVGRRGLACLQYAAGVENDPFTGDLGIMLGPMTRVLMQHFGIDGLNMVCASTYEGRKLLAQANGEEEPREEISKANYTLPMEKSEERRTQTCEQTTAIYPNNALVDPDGIYTQYATSMYQGYIRFGDPAQRSDTPTVVERIQNEIQYLKDVAVGLDTCTSIWSAINSAIGIADVPFVDPEMISESILSFSCVLANDYNSIVLSRKYRDLERLQFHDQLIDSAETKAAYENTKTMMADVCAVTSTMGRMKLELEVIEASMWHE